ncbi:hypothetical protein BKA63DRAFT_512436 [Paraphoma chrysanthemicola]|nr:hypothetical protein BKA63DRAFT_512436 [Paraphoma chrysanthemicola]
MAQYCTRIRVLPSSSHLASLPERNCGLIRLFHFSKSCRATGLTSAISNPRVHVFVVLHILMGIANFVFSFWVSLRLATLSFRWGLWIHLSRLVIYVVVELALVLVVRIWRFVVGTDLMECSGPVDESISHWNCPARCLCYVPGPGGITRARRQRTITSLPQHVFLLRICPSGPFLVVAAFIFLLEKQKVN